MLRISKKLNKDNKGKIFKTMETYRVITYYGYSQKNPEGFYYLQRWLEID